MKKSFILTFICLFGLTAFANKFNLTKTTPAQNKNVILKTVELTFTFNDECGYTVTSTYHVFCCLSDEDILSIAWNDAFDLLNPDTGCFV